jgi:subtilase family serine protease
MFTNNEPNNLYIAKSAGSLMLAMMLLCFAATPSRTESFTPLVGDHPDAAADLAAQGTTVPTYQPLRMEVYLNPRNEAQLEQLLQDQQDPKSPQYHKFLTPDEYDQQFGPSDDDVAQVSNWLTSQGFTVTGGSAHDRRISFTGDVTTAQAAFLVHFAGSRDGTIYANVDDPQIPEELAPKISHLSGLDNINHNHWNTLIPMPPANITVPKFGPTDIRTFYNEGPLLSANLNGNGQCIAVSEGSDVDQASLKTFNDAFGLPEFVPGTNYFSVFPDGSPGQGSEGGGSPYAEALLDIEYAHGLAPGAAIVLYAANAGLSNSNRTSNLVDTAIAATSDKVHHCYTVAISWAQCGEPSSFFTNLEKNAFMPGAAQGQSIFVATGDVGAAASAPGSCAVPPTPAKPNIEENAGSDFVTAVGASMFKATYDSNNNNISTDANTKESVWNINLNIDNFFVHKAASTGGYSKIFPLPSWQKGIVAGKFRAVPDLVLGGGDLGGALTETFNKKTNKTTIKGSDFAAPGFWECYDQGLASSANIASGPVCTVTGGTSIVPPQYAAIFAIINQKTAAPMGQGLINPKLYAMAQANLKNLAKVGVLDIVTGNNSYSPVKGYSAKKGFDVASGWGAIDFTNFVNAFAAFTP